MISEKEVLEIHAILIERFGGSDGVRDKELLDSALNRPFQTFDEKDFIQHLLTRLPLSLKALSRTTRSQTAINELVMC